MSSTESPLPVETKAPRIAAVLFLVYPRRGQAHVVFTERSATISNHAGQVSLPGGSRDATDPTLEFTALRETEEELGVPAHLIRVLGTLSEVDTLGGTYRITPVVGLLDHEPAFRVQETEVAEVVEVPLDLLRDPSIIGSLEREVRGVVMTMPSYSFGRHRIYGPTGWATAEFLTSGYPELAERELGFR
jgi:8-oxo-dGTP pyrophosphatase MutT (NUDIX family)